MGCTITPVCSCFGRVRSVGWLAVVGNSFAALALLMFDYQSGGHGEMGSFYRSNMIWFLGFAARGLGTGIGLLRAWRWARISTLIFSGLLAALGILGVVGVLSMAAGNISGGMVLAARVLPTLLFVIPIVIGYRWLVFFSRTEVKAYFGRTRPAANWAIHPSCANLSLIFPCDVELECNALVYKRGCQRK